MELAFQLWPSQELQAQLPPPRGNIALLHGMGGTGALWRPVAASLENHYRVMAFDQRGHGRSQGPQEDFAPLDYGRDVIETLASQNFHPTWLIGHSMGVRSACAAAHLKPDWVQGLVLIDLGFFGPAGGGLGDNLAHFLRILPQSFPTREDARRFMSENCPDPSIAQYLMAVSARTPEGQVTFPFDHGALIQTIEAARDFSMRGWLRELGERGMPVLVLRGAESGVWSRAEFENERERFKDLPSIVFKEIEGASHGLPFEQRQRFLAEVGAFIEGKSRES